MSAFRDRILKGIEKVREEKRLQFKDGNQRRVEVSVILENMKKLTPEEVGEIASEYFDEKDFVRKVG